ncbi:MAG: GerMN domain-containing protein [Desulfobacterales bacterium]
MNNVKSRLNIQSLLMITDAQSRHNRTILAVIGILSILGAICFFFQSAHAQRKQLTRTDSLLQPAGPTQPKKSVVHLYFADRNNYYLMSEQRVVSHSGDLIDHARSIVEALIKGPQKSLARTIAVGTELRAIYIIPAGVCFVDLSRAVAKDHPGGCHSELLTIYSVVNSLILNIPEIKYVKLLIGGKEAHTLAGHIDLEFPLEADIMLIR